jgi:hypothetical protein
MEKTYIASALIHATMAIRAMGSYFAPNKNEMKLIHNYQYPSMHGGKRTGFAAARRTAKKNRNIRARASK